MGILSLISGWPGPSGFGSASTAEQVTDSIDASHLTVIITGTYTHDTLHIHPIYNIHPSVCMNLSITNSIFSQPITTL